MARLSAPRAAFAARYEKVGRREERVEGSAWARQRGNSAVLAYTDF